MIEEGLEISTAVGCPVSCWKYCAQEVIIRRYDEVSRCGTKMMRLERFKQYIRTVPKTVTIQFSGVCEPFVNPACIDMIEYACEQGYKVNLYTTLVGCKRDMMNRLIKLKLNYVLLHLPDALGIAHIPITDEYKDVLTTALTQLPTAAIITMNPPFITNHREDVARGKVKKRKRYPVMCNALYTPQRVLLPNGSVYLCCCDHKFEGYLGNLMFRDYDQLDKPKRIDSCRYCGLATFTPLYLFKTFVLPKISDMVRTG